MATSEKSRTDGLCPFNADHCCLPQDHEIDLVLCANLESLADSLPGLPSTRDLRHLTERLQLASVRWSSSALPALSNGEHQSAGYRLLDAVHAEDVIDAIWSYWREPKSSDAERLAYMLRALFDGCRRATMIERITLGCSRCQFSAAD